MDDSRPALHSTSNSNAKLLSAQRELASSQPVAECWCHTTVRITKMRYIWTISNFSFCREDTGEILKSSTFSSGPQDKLKWCLRINPKGLDDDSKEYLSLYLLLTNSGANKEARAKFRFSILNGRREETKAMESQRAYRFVQGKDWGFKKFIRRDVLMDEANGLLPNDQLTVLCEVSVVGETFSESGQLNARPMSIFPCNLHNDMEELLKNELFSDVVLVIVEPNPDSIEPEFRQHTRSQRLTNEAIAVPSSDFSEVKNDYAFDYTSDNFLLNGSYSALNELHNSNAQHPNNDDDTTTEEDEINEENFQYGDDEEDYEEASTNLTRNLDYLNQDQDLAEENGEASVLQTGRRNSQHNQTLSEDSNEPNPTASRQAVSSARSTFNSGHNEASALVPPSRSVTETLDNAASSTCSSSSSSLRESVLGRSSKAKNRIGNQEDNDNVEALSSLAASSSISSSAERSNQVRPDDGRPQEDSPGDAQATSSTDAAGNSFNSRPVATSSDTVDAKAGQPTSTTYSHSNKSATYEACNSSTVSKKEADKPNQSDQTDNTCETTVCQQPSFTTRPSLTNAVSSTAAPKVLREFRAHKAVLAARSPVFAAMFEHRMEESREGRVEINDLKPECMADVLRFIYTGRCSNLEQLAPELLAASDKYQMDQLKMICELRLVQGLCVENACDTLVLADRHNAPQLKVHTLDFIMLHADEICETEGFDELSRLQPHLLNECFRALAVQHLPLRYSSRKRPRPTP